MTGRSLALLLGVALACGEPHERELGESGNVVFVSDVVATIPLRVSRDTVPRGIGRLDMDVALPAGIDAPTARATLQHLIDSAAAADTMLGAVRVTGFVPGEERDDGSGIALNPALTATWLPVDSLGVTGRQRRSRFRTHFILHLPLPERPEPGGS